MREIRHHKRRSLLLSTAILAVAGNNAYANNFGTEVTNDATISYDSGGNFIIIPTNEAVFTIRPPRSTPKIQFFRYSPNSPSARMVTITGSNYSPSGDLQGPFFPVSLPDDANIQSGKSSQKLDLSSPIAVAPAETYISGEVIFIQVDFIGANENSSEIESFSVIVESDAGDSITLQLFESGEDSSEFWGVLPSKSGDIQINDDTLTMTANTDIKATAISEDGVETEIVIDTAAANPINTVFDSVTGAAIDGAVIRLVDLNTRSSAHTFGVDGFSEFPSTIISGESIEDTSGLLYQNAPGEFTFPYLEEGQYVVEVKPPEGYSFASILPPEQINELTGEGYFLLNGSFGEAFEIETDGPLRFDIPLDPIGALSVTKSADRDTADIGDFVNYTVTVENTAANALPVRLHDILPDGFRYVLGTATIESLPTRDPEISDTGTELTFPMDLLEPNETQTISYALEIGPAGFLGDGINQAYVLDGSGKPISNIARAAVRLEEDLFRSHSTIIGRVTEDACNIKADWSRKISEGRGVEGVRLYMETGAYAVSDMSGLFHFEGVEEGTHIVQVDKHTLPEGFEIAVCEENTRYAGNGASMFIDVQGGGIWRANFYLKKTGASREDTQIDQTLNDSTAYKAFDQDWLDKQDAEPAWAYPDTTQTPSQPSVNIGIKHPIGASVELMINGQKVSPRNFTGRETSSNGKVALSRWRGVDILRGENPVTAIIRNADKTLLKTLHNEIAYVENIARASGIIDRSSLVADGRTPPRLAIRLEDENGRPVHAGRMTKIDITGNYRLYDENETRELEQRSSDIASPLGAEQSFSVGMDGIVEVLLEPTLQTGKVTANVTLDNGRVVPIHMYLEPEKRDWVIVGLAEGSVGHTTLREQMQILTDSGVDSVSDGRAAFFAKGLVKGNWLVTAAYDSAKKTGARDSDFLSEIDPNAYYTLYGDRSYQNYEAQSRYPLYLKLEKKSAYALFGDFSTNITEGRLTAYNRRLSGLKGEYIGEKVQLLGFAAETNQGFAKDELPANGTSGDYQLSSKNILAQSETILVETRDRDRPDIILETRTLTRFVDYTLDYLTGELIFSFPVNVSDANFNPNVIVVDYETAEDAERNITMGGRVQSLFWKDRLRLGSSFISENGSNLIAGSQTNLIGVDAVAQVTDKTEVRLEYAASKNDTQDDGAKTAMLAEVIHTSDRLSGEAYFREEQGGFGVGQRNSNTADIRRYGLRGSFKLNEFADKTTGRRGIQTLNGAVSHEDNLDTGDTRDTAEIKLTRQGERLSLSGGLRSVNDNFVSKDDRQSLLALTQATLRVPKHGMIFSVTHEQPLGGKDAVSSNPQRTLLSIDKTLGKNVTATLTHEFLKGATTEAQNTVLGISVSPWKGSVLTASADAITNDNSRRLGASLGMDQQVRFNDNWSGSVGVRNRKVFDDQGEFVEVTPDAAISPLETNQDFTSAYLGVGYKSEKMAASARAEARRATDGQTWIGTASIARELSEELSMAGAVRGAFVNPKMGESSSQIDARLGTAWRPRDNGLTFFNRFDYGSKSAPLTRDRTKLVNNFAVNSQFTDRWQVTANHGIKYVKEDLGATTVDSLTNLFGFEMRYDVSERIDIGIRGSAIIDDSGSRHYGYGPSVGLSPLKNVWVSAGYNLTGYTDPDFEASEYARKGAYIQMRVKFDQDTASNLLRRISPGH
jgi:uncharacterized repeat protein (TIGR01451 family)